MSADSDSFRLRLLVPRVVRQLPADLLAVVGLLGATSLVVLTPGLRATPLRFVAAPYALFAPGYALVSALFPGAGDAAEDSGVGWVERLGFSVASSVAVVAILAVALDLAPWGIRAVPVLLAIDAFVLVGVGAAAYRRWSLPESERFAVPYDRWLATLRADLFDADGRRETAVNAALAVGLLLATASVAYAVAVPGGDQPYTEFYLLTENETGNLVVADYPEELDAGAADSLRVGLSNHEGRQMEYVLVAERQRVATGNNSTRILERRELTRRQVSVGANESWTGRLGANASLSGEQARLALYLYRGDAPGQASRETAYRTLRLAGNVSAGNGTASASGNATA